MGCFPKNNDNAVTVIYTLKDDFILTENEIDYLTQTLDSVISELFLKGYFIRNFQDNSCHYS